MVLLLFMRRPMNTFDSTFYLASKKQLIATENKYKTTNVLVYTQCLFSDESRGDTMYFGISENMVMPSILGHRE